MVAKIRTEMQDDVALIFSAEFPSIKLLPSLQKHPGKTSCAQCSQLVAKIRPEMHGDLIFIFCGISGQHNLGESPECLFVRSSDQ